MKALSLTAVGVLVLALDGTAIAKPPGFLFTAPIQAGCELLQMYKCSAVNQNSPGNTTIGISICDALECVETGTVSIVPGGELSLTHNPTTQCPPLEAWCTIVVESNARAKKVRGSLCTVSTNTTQPGSPGSFACTDAR